MQKKIHRRLLCEQLERRTVMAAGLGVTAQYFSDTELTSLVASRIENSLNQDWGTGVPVVGLNADQFSARFTGQVEAKSTGLHTFSLSTEVGARLWINGVKAIDRWTDISIAGATAQLDMVAGRRYDIQLEIRETTGLASQQLLWSSSSMPAQGIATGSLFPSERGAIESRHWNSLPGTAVSTLTTLATYPNQPVASSLINKLEINSTGLDQYGQLIVGTLYPPKSGSYRFYIAGDDSAEVWLSNSASLLGKERIAFLSSATAVRDWTATPSQQSAAITLVAGQAYAIEVVHKENSGADHLSVGWKAPGSTTIEVIDGQYLAPPLATVKIFSQRPDAVEGEPAPIEFVIERSGPLTNPLTVAYGVGGTASAGSDYLALPVSITIPAGAATATIAATTLADAATEAAEVLQIELQDGPGYNVGMISQRTSLATIQNVGAAVPGGTVVTPAMTLGNFGYFGGNFSQITPAAPYNAIMQAAITSVPANRWDAQLRLPYNAAIQQGDILWAEFYVRAMNGSGMITVVSERNSDPYTKSLDRGISVTTQWSRVQLPFTSLETYAAGAASLSFFLGAQVQTLQFADVVVRNYGVSRNITPGFLGLNNIEGQYGNAATVAVTGQAFPLAMEITTVTEPANNDSWRLQYGGRNSSRVRNGDTLQLDFYARGISGATPRLAVAIQTTSNFATLTYQPVTLTSAWQHIIVNTTLTADFAREGLQAMLNVGFAPQAIQVAAIKWTNLSAATDAADLPTLAPPTSYLGRAATDTWRTSADERIALERQSTLTVNVVDTAGNPVNGAAVSLRQTRHSFIFGSAIDGVNNLLSPTGGPDALKYQSEIKRLFNGVTIENSLKWPVFLDNRQRGLDAAAWVVNNGLMLRGHNVIWPSRNNMPGIIWTEYDSRKTNQGDAAAATYLRQTIEARFQDAIGTFANQVREWDIVNEPYDNHAVMDILGNQTLIDWFLLARQIDPDVDRVLNDYDIFARNGNNTAHRANYDNWLTQLKAANAIERMGEQSHYSESTFTDIEVLGQLFQSYQSQFNLPIAITEFDVESLSAQLQADYLRDYMTMSFSQGKVDQFILWGFWSQAHWKPGSALYNADFSIRPNGQVYEDLVFGDWWTDTRGTTRGGAYATDVFEGNYVVTVSLGNQTVTQSLANITSDGSITIVVNQLPSVADQTFVINENTVTAPGTVVASDSDAGQTLTYSILGGNAGNVFGIHPSTGLLSIINASAINFEQQSSFALTIRVTDNGVPAQSSDAQVTVQLVDLPELIGNVAIGDSSPQRSLIKQLAVTFDSPVILDVGAFALTKRGAAGVVTTIATQTTNVSGQSVVTLTFSGLHTRGLGALDDGYYQLVIDGTKIRRGAQTLDLNQDGVGGDSRNFGASEADGFFALFGDTNGDGLVGVVEFGQFRTAFGKLSGDVGYNLLFDYEQDNSVGVSDFGQFRSRFGKPKLAF